MRQLGFHRQLVIPGNRRLPFRRRWRADALPVRPAYQYALNHLRTAQAAHLWPGALFGRLAAPYPYVLYSDLYDHKEFIRGVANMGFSGLLWTPELRNGESTEDLIRRLQSVVLSPMALINAWYIKNPPWKQVKRTRTMRTNLSPDWQEVESPSAAP